MSPTIPAAVICLLISGQAAAEPAAPIAAASATATTPAASGWHLDLTAGAALFTQSQSFAPQHLAEPIYRLGATFHPSRGDGTRSAALGGEAVLAALGEEGYRILAAQLVIRAPLIQGEVFDWGLRFGMGLGSGPPILSEDLVAEADLMPWAHWGMELRWRLGDSVSLGLELIEEQWSILEGLVALHWRL